MKKIIAVMFVVVIILSACTKNPEKEEMPDNFRFSLCFNTYGRDIIDTYKNTFTKDLVAAGTETIDFIIPLDKMREIYDKFVEYEISELPADINAEALKTMGELQMSAEPAAKYNLTYTLNDETKTIICNGEGPWDGVKGYPEFYNRFIDFVQFISEYIYSTEEYQMMSPIEGGYE